MHRPQEEAAMAYDRFHDDDMKQDHRDRLPSDREWREGRQFRGYDDRDSRDERDHDRERGLFRGGRDDRDPDSRRGRERDHDDRHQPRGRDPREQERGSSSAQQQGRAPIPTDETRDLIASHKVEGTAVYGRDDERLGTIKTLMLDKYRGEVRYAVLAQGSGFLGLEEQLFPVQWNELRYDERRQGYRVDFTSEDVAYTLENRRRSRMEGRNLDEEGRARR